jgi:DNA invertase Pin-like site-specific DNA recombinase
MGQRIGYLRVSTVDQKTNANCRLVEPNYVVDIANR